MIRAALLALALAIPATQAIAQAQPMTASVPLGPFRAITVIDGDSVVMNIPGGMMTGVRIRLAGIDTPEMRGQCAEEVTAARAAAAALRLLAVDGVALVTAMETDQYGRLTGRLFNRQGQDLSLLMIEAGHARPYSGRTARLGWCG